jgi:transposase InsO family protein
VGVVSGLPGREKSISTWRSTSPAPAPTDNAHIEAFNSRLRAECLNTSWFLSLADARTGEAWRAWRREYNEERPHGHWET